MRPASSSLGVGWLVVVVAAVPTVVEGSLFNQPDWGFWCYPGEDYTLHCNHSSLPLQPSNFIRWELPSGVQLDTNDDSEKYELKSDAGAQVINMHLTIRNVQDADSGVYLCHVYSTSSLQNKRGHLLRGLNMGSHLYREPFDQYRHSLLVGGCTAAALFGLLLAGCLIYKFRYRVPKQPPDSPLGHHVNGANAHQRHHDLEVGQGTELSAVQVVAQKDGEVNGSYDLTESEMFATRM